MSIKQKIGSAVATASLMAAVLAPSAFAATNVTIQDNGFGTKNGVAVVNSNKSVVKQRNRTSVNTFVASSTNTGGNHSSFNTGGSNTIGTGSSTTGAMVNVAGGTNTNTSESCGCPMGDTTVDISDNGAFSHNGVLVVNSNTNVVKQSNSTSVNTAVVSHTNTGNNSSSFNTGGSNSITTGDSTTAASVTVTGSSNSNL